MGYVYIALMLIFTLYGQLILKWRISFAEAMPGDVAGQLLHVSRLLLSPWVLSGLAAAFLASIFWMMALSRLELSRAYPFTALGLVLVITTSAIVFGESLTPGKVVGTAIIVVGVCVVAAFS